MSKVLVTFFSATGVTQNLADRFARELNADCFEIKPAELYTEADLDWKNETSRSSLEMKDRNCRPEMMSKIDDISEYEVIFIGFPIWWYREPSIIDSFMEAYDFTGKVIVPFATSGSSDMGETTKNLQELAPTAIVKEGKVFKKDVDATFLKMWASSFTQ